jgi:hypothetical protein
MPDSCLLREAHGTLKAGRARGSNVDRADTNPGPPKRAAVSKGVLRSGLVCNSYDTTTVPWCDCSKLHGFQKIIASIASDDDRAAGVDCAIVNRFPGVSVENGS